MDVFINKNQSPQTWNVGDNMQSLLNIYSIIEPSTSHINMAALEINDIKEHPKI